MDTDTFVELTADEPDESVEPEQDVVAEPEAAPEPEVPDDIPEDLLTDEQRAARATRKQREDDEKQRSRQADNDQFVSALREVFSGMRPQQQAPQAAPQAAPPQQGPPPITKERAAEITRKILEEEDGLYRALDWAANVGAQRAVASIRSQAGGVMAASADSIVDRFASRKLAGGGMAKAIEPFFQKLVDEHDLSQIAALSREERDSQLENLWRMAAGDMVQEKGRLTGPKSPGIARGTSAGGVRARATRQRMSEAEKKQVYAVFPNTKEGRERAQRQIAKIEWGVEDNPEIARQTAESLRFSDMSRFG
jgi:hypothetical protein